MDTPVNAIADFHNDLLNLGVFLREIAGNVTM
jgi:hypothetical protein